MYFCNSYQLVNELSNESRFKKSIGTSLTEVRSLVGDGLFTVSVFAWIDRFM